MLKELKLYGGKVTIKFDDERHIFYGEQGETLFSVTGATKVIDKSGALMGWTAKMMAEYMKAKWNDGMDRMAVEDLIERAKKEYRFLQKEAADIGTEIHKWIEQWIAGKNPEMPDNSKVVNGITAFLRFQKEHQFKWIESERIIYSKKHGYAGILDAIASSKDYGIILADFKSSNGIYTEMRFQVAGYQLAWEEETSKKIDKRMIIRFGKETGEFEVCELSEDTKDKKSFLAALELARRIKEVETKRRGS